MANIGKLPTAAELLRGTPRRGKYGERLLFEIDGTVVTLLSPENVHLVQADGPRIKVDMHALDPMVVPYVNAFVAHSGKRIEKYWRTKQYRIVETGAAALADLEPAPQTDILALLSGGTTPRDKANRLRTLAILIHEAADALEREPVELLEGTAVEAPIALPVKPAKAVAKPAAKAAVNGAHS